MNHKVTSVSELYNASQELYNNVVRTDGDNTIQDLANAIETLKETWKGADAGVQIQNVIDVHNAMVNIRNLLSELSRESSTIASNYREIQRANKANLDSLAPITVDSKSTLPQYTDNGDLIDIQEHAIEGKNLIDKAEGELENFITNATNSHNRIMGIWTAGIGRNEADEAFRAFIEKSGEYQEILANVSLSIDQALRNYSFDI